MLRLAASRLVAAGARGTAARAFAATANAPFTAADDEKLDEESSLVMPLKLHGMAARYASALYMSAHKTNELKVVEEELKAVRPR